MLRNRTHARCAGSPHTSYAAQVSPVQCSQGKSAHETCNGNLDELAVPQPKIPCRQSSCGCAPERKQGNRPLHEHRRSIQRDAFSRSCSRLCEQFLHANGPTPGNHNAEKKEDQPKIPGHSAIRTFSAPTVQAWPRPFSGVQARPPPSSV